MPVGVTSPNLGTSVIGVTLPDYGRDLSCTNDLDPAALEVTGLQCLAQALYRRIITPRGQLIDDPNYGFDITQFLNDDLSQSDLARISSGIDSEFLKDERVFRSQTTSTMPTTGVLLLVSSITPSSGPSFRLVITSSAVTSQILQVGT